jgi:hypothetical protein
MTRITRLVLVVALAACGKKGGAGSSDCAAAVDHMTSLQVSAMTKEMDEKMKKQVTEMMNKTKGALIKSCQDTKWSADAISCIKSLKSAEEGKKCDGKLTKDQEAAAQKAAESGAEEANKPSDDEKTAAIKGITALRDEMCACKDKACGEAVYQKWGPHEHDTERARHDEATKTAWEKIDDEMMDCMKKLQ